MARAVHAARAVTDASSLATGQASAGGTSPATAAGRAQRRAGVSRGAGRRRSVSRAWTRAARTSVADRAADRVLGPSEAREAQLDAASAAWEASHARPLMGRSTGGRGHTSRALTTSAELAYVAQGAGPELDSPDASAAVARDGRPMSAELQAAAQEVGATRRDVEAAKALAVADRGLVRALSRATGTADVVRVLVERPAEAAVLARSLSGPAARVVQQITRMQTLPEDAAEVLSAPVVAGSEDAPAARRRARKGSSVRRVRGWGGTSRATASGQDGAGEGRLMKLSRKLRDLIHLAEVERRQGDAQRQVRRSDEKVEASDAAGAQGDLDVDDVSLEVLQREVLEAVQRELELMSDRREGGPNGGFWW